MAEDRELESIPASTVSPELAHLPGIKVTREELRRLADQDPNRDLQPTGTKFKGPPSRSNQ